MAKDHLKLLETSQSKYNSIGKVFCPVLNSYVYFTAEGYRHLIYKTNRKKRNVAEQCLKLELFGLVIPVIKYADSIQTWRFAGEQGGVHDVQHYALVRAVGKSPIEIRVIIKRANDGQFNFHSVMRHTKKRRTGRR